MSGEPSKAQLYRALEQGKALLKADKLKPAISDYVSEGVLKHAPEPDAQGKINVKVQGHDNVVRMLQMNEAHYFAKHDVGKERQALIRRVPMRGADGKVRMVAEQREDISGRKHKAVRLASVRYGRPRRVEHFQRIEGRIPWPWERA